MKKLFVLFTLLSVLMLGGPKTDNPGFVGKVWPSEKKIVENNLGYEVTQWTTNSLNWHLYFNIESFIDDSSAVMYSDRTGEINLFKLNLHNGQMTQMTNESHIKSEVWHLSKYKTIWYFNGDTLKALNTMTFESKPVYVFTESKPESFSVTCDAKYLVYSINKNPGYSDKCTTGPYAMFKLNMNTKESIQISPEYGFKMSHILCNPTDTNLISYCWQHIYVKEKPGIYGLPPIRIWWLNLAGTDGGPVTQEYGLHRTHEFWYPDGSMLGFSARYKFDSLDGKQFLGAAKLTGGDHFMVPLNIGAAHAQIFTDYKTWVSDIYNGSNIALFTIHDRKLTDAKILFKHDSSWKTSPSEPCAQFSPDGNYVIFNTDKSGVSQVYTVKIKSSKK